MTTRLRGLLDTGVELRRIPSAAGRYTSGGALSDRRISTNVATLGLTPASFMARITSANNRGSFVRLETASNRLAASTNDVSLSLSSFKATSSASPLDRFKNFDDVT